MQRRGVRLGTFFDIHATREMGGRVFYLDCYLSRELDGYKVRLGAIRAKDTVVVSCRWKEKNKHGRAYCQNVSGSGSCRHSGPNPNLNEETDHLARWLMSGQSISGGFLTVFHIIR